MIWPHQLHANRGGIQARVSNGLSPRAKRRVMAFLANCPSATWVQEPDFPRLCPAAARHRYVMVSAYSNGGQLQGFGLARLSQLFPGRCLASFRSGPVTRHPSALAVVLPAMAVKLREIGCCSLRLNPRWHGAEAVAEVGAVLRSAGARELTHSKQPQRTATGLVDLGGSPADLLARLTARGRGYLRQAEQAGITVRPPRSLQEVQEYEALMRGLYGARGLRQPVLPPATLQWAMTRDRGAFLLAWQRGRLLGGHVMIADGERAVWLVLALALGQGGAGLAGYQLVWEAMKLAQQQGFAVFDMDGAPASADAPAAINSVVPADGGGLNCDPIKSAFNPGISPLVGVHVLPLRRPSHDILFGLSQKLRSLRQGWLQI